LGAGLVAARVWKETRESEGIGEDGQGWGLEEDAREWGLGEAANQILAAETDVRARMKVGPTCNQRRVEKGHYMGLASERRACRTRK
jgi:hypothetical protein